MTNLILIRSLLYVVIITIFSFIIFGCTTVMIELLPSASTQSLNAAHLACLHHREFDCYITSDNQDCIGLYPPEFLNVCTKVDAAWTNEQNDADLDIINHYMEKSK